MERFGDIEYRKDLEANRVEHGELADGFSLPRTDRQRRFDAMIAIFGAAATAGDTATPAMPLVNIVIDATTWGNMLLAAGLSTDTDLDGRRVDPFTGLSADSDLDGCAVDPFTGLATNRSRPSGETGEMLDDLLDVLLDVLLDDFFDGDGLAGFDQAMCETTNGVTLHAHDVLRAALAGHVRRVVVDQHDAAVLYRGHNNDTHHRRFRTRRATNHCSYTIREDGTIIIPSGARPSHFTDHPNPGHPDGDEPDDGNDDDTPEEVARLTSLAHTRLDTLTRPRTA